MEAIVKYTVEYEITVKVKDIGNLPNNVQSLISKYSDVGFTEESKGFIKLCKVMQEELESITIPSEQPSQYVENSFQVVQITF